MSIQISSNVLSILHQWMTCTDEMVLTLKQEIIQVLAPFTTLNLDTSNLDLHCGKYKNKYYSRSNHESDYVWNISIQFDWNKFIINIDDHDGTIQSIYVLKTYHFANDDETIRYWQLRDPTNVMSKLITVDLDDKRLKPQLAQLYVQSEPVEDSSLADDWYFPASSLHTMTHVALGCVHYHRYGILVGVVMVNKETYQCHWLDGFTDDVYNMAGVKLEQQTLYMLNASEDFQEFELLYSTPNLQTQLAQYMPTLTDQYNYPTLHTWIPLHAYPLSVRSAETQN